MGGLLEGLPLSFITSVIYAFGLPGVVLILWYVDNRRYDRQEKKRDAEMSAMLAAREKEIGKLLDAQKEDTAAVLRQYREDVRQVTRFYEDNVLLVKNTQRLADDLAGIIHLNTQAQTQLVESIRHNMFCPVVREKKGITA